VFLYALWYVGPACLLLGSEAVAENEHGSLVACHELLRALYFGENSKIGAGRELGRQTRPWIAVKYIKGVCVFLKAANTMVSLSRKLTFAPKIPSSFIRL